MMPLSRAVRRWPTLLPFLLLALLLAAPSARAQDAGAPPNAATLVQASAGQVTIPAGGQAEARLTLRIAPGWHVNANPPSPDYLIPTTVTLPASGGVSLGHVVYPKGTEAKLAFDDNPLSVYSGEITLVLPVRAAVDAADGGHTLRGTIRFQSCNDQVCLAPATIPFSLAVVVTGGAKAGAAPSAAVATPDTAAGAAAESTAAIEPGAGAESASSRTGAPLTDMDRRVAGALASGGLGWWLFLFGAGLLLNLTPCVFPMLGITVSIFGARRKEPTIKVLSHAIAYVIGIAVTYSVLGVAAALTGSLFGSALQNPWVNVGLGALIIGLSLSMFGLYELQPPAWIMQRLGGAEATSLTGSLLSGLGVGIIAAPCVGALVVSILGLIAQRANLAFGFQTMFMLSLGLGFPYIFLALFSNLIQNLPRSGDWMLWVKKFFGIGLVGLGLFYVSIGLAPALTEWVLPAALIVGGVYLGYVDRHGAQWRGFTRFKRGFGTLATLAGVAMVALAVVRMQHEGVRFRPYDEGAMRAALAAGRPVMLDFSADWCIPCHEMEHGAFADRRVVGRSRSFEAFRVDLTRYDSPGSKTLRTRYGVTGVPEVLFFVPGGGELRALRVIGPLSPDRFLARLDAVAAAAKPR